MKQRVFLIAALGAPLKATGGALIVTSGTGMAAPGRPSSEDAPPPSSAAIPRAASEEAALALAADGVNAGIVRLPQVHDTRRQGLISYMSDTARRTGVSAYVGDGQARWAAAHISDTARLLISALKTVPFPATAGQSIRRRAGSRRGRAACAREIPAG